MTNNFAEINRGSGRDAEQSPGCYISARAILRSVEQVLPHHWEPRLVLQGCPAVLGMCGSKRPTW